MLYDYDNQEYKPQYNNYSKVKVSYKSNRDYQVDDIDFNRYIPDNEIWEDTNEDREYFKIDQDNFNFKNQNQPPHSFHEEEYDMNCGIIDPEGLYNSNFDDEYSEI